MHGFFARNRRARDSVKTVKTERFHASWIPTKIHADAGKQMRNR